MKNPIRLSLMAAAIVGSEQVVAQAVLEEITVTAQREESLQDASVAICA